MAKNIMGWSTMGQPKMFFKDGKLFRKPIDLANILQKYYVDKVVKLMVGLEKKGAVSHSDILTLRSRDGKTDID